MRVLYALPVRKAFGGALIGLGLAPLLATLQGWLQSHLFVLLCAFLVSAGSLFLVEAPLSSARSLWHSGRARLFRKKNRARAEQAFRALRPLVEGLLDQWENHSWSDHRLETLNEKLPNLGLYPRGILRDPGKKLLWHELEFLRRAMVDHRGYEVSLRVFGVDCPWSAEVSDPHDPNIGGFPDYDHALDQLGLNE